MQKFREAVMRFMAGRNGSDSFCLALMVFYLVLWALNLIFNSAIIGLVALAIVIYTAFRMLSRNITKRQLENRKFLEIYNKVKNKFSKNKNSNSGNYYYDKTVEEKVKKPKADKTHIFRTCPKCSANLRLPKKFGRHTVRCPRCDERFKVTVIFK